MDGLNYICTLLIIFLAEQFWSLQNNSDPHRTVLILKERLRSFRNESVPCRTAMLRTDLLCSERTTRILPERFSSSWNTYDFQNIFESPKKLFSALLSFISTQTTHLQLHLASRCTKRRCSLKKTNDKPMFLTLDMSSFRF